MRKLLIASLVSTIILMAWGMFFWTTVSLKTAGISNSPSEDALVYALKQNLPESGVYMAPYPPSPKDLSYADFPKKYLKGPIVQIFYQAEGSTPMSFKKMFLGTIHAFLSSLLIAWLLSKACNNIPAYFDRVIFVTVAGVFAAISVEVAYPIWWSHAWGFHIVSMLEQIISWFLAGLALAGLIKTEA